MPWLFTLGCVALMLLCMPRERPEEVIATAWLAAALLSAELGVMQYFGVSASLGSWVNSTGLGEAFANLRQRNQFATLTNIGLGALLWCAVRVRALAPRRQQWAHAGLLLAALLLAVGNAASSSRTGLLQLVALALLVWLWGGWKEAIPRSVMLAAILGYAAAALALPGLAGLDPGTTGILARLGDSDRPCASRLTLWANVLHLIALRPWTGWGWGELDFAHFMTLYPAARFCDILDNAHNLPLHLAVELGVPMAALACVAALWLTLRAAPWREGDPTRQMAWTVLAMLGLHSMLEYPLWYGPFQVAAGLSIWLLLRPRVRSAQGGARQRAGVAVALLLATGYAGWDYHRVSQIYLAPEQRAASYRTDTRQQAEGSWLFSNQVRFAELTTTPVSRANALHLNALSKELLHFSPEPRVIEKLIESATLLGRDEEALHYLARYRAAFPDEQRRWSSALQDQPQPVD
ncbi:Wzy polymerase domain-containing protein [Rhodoferax sp.]|uniref:Wzy polymerase domain-containing protein n=1 Tax=Rhodoferax sp. TaxID=50421 RepID=UPI002765A6FD|nr:Wzy polymerase domain-containing protein [Rhodoferax sp.]